MRSRLQFLLDAGCTLFLTDVTRSDGQWICVPAYAGKDIAKNLSVFS